MNSARVIVASTRAAEGVYDDLTGPVIEAWLEARGWELHPRLVVPDGDWVATALRDTLGLNPDLVITTGGTGVSPTDRTPEMTRPLLDAEIPGIMEELRRRGAAKSARAILSRGLAGISGSTFVINLPGSPGGVKDGLGLLDEILSHVIDQLKGIDHAG
jgi:molybdenum cofactor synthesis domain-containing protein